MDRLEQEDHILCPEEGLFLKIFYFIYIFMYVCLYAFFLNFFKDLYIYFRKRVCTHMHMGVGVGWGGERMLSRLPAEWGAPHQAWSHDSEIKTCAKIKGLMPNQLRHPGAQKRIVKVDLCQVLLGVPDLDTCTQRYVPSRMGVIDKCTARLQVFRGRFQVCMGASWWLVCNLNITSFSVTFHRIFVVFS